jgi:AcrR family transcriptional regulator
MLENKKIKKTSTTKLKIKEVATTLFSQYGYKGTSVRKIARNVGIRESALYNHFKNKEEIFLTITQDIFSSSLVVKSNEVVDLALKGKDFLQKFTMNYKKLTLDKNSESMFRLLMIELMQNKEFREEFMKQYNKDIKLLSEAFFIMMQNNLIRSSDPMVMAYEYMSTLFQIRLQVTILKVDAKSVQHLSTQFEKHVEFFWENIKIEKC